MWTRFETLSPARVERLLVGEEDEPLSYAEVARRWVTDEPFRERFLAALAEPGFGAVFWETPPVTRATVERPFECVLVDAPALARMPPHRAAFAEHFTDDEPGVVTFPNLGGDAWLVAPCPRGPDAAYGHLTAFLRGAPPPQQHALLAATGRALQERLDERPVWLSTSGLGIAWLHVRLDDQPKYYTHAPYRRAP